MAVWDFGHHPHRPPIIGTRHAVSSGHYLATQAGFAILEAGGNAVDAGVATGIALNVVESQMCSFSGVAPTMIYLRERGEIVTIDGLGTWPAAASCAFFQKRGDKIVPEGILQTVVPAACDSWLTALERYGTMRFRDVAAAAIRLARDGFPMHPQMSLTLKRKRGGLPARHRRRADLLSGRPRARAGRALRPDAISRARCNISPMKRKPPRKKGREGAIRAARDAFYKGDIAQKFARFQRENGGLLTEEDMASYRGADRAGVAHQLPRHRHP